MCTHHNNHHWVSCGASSSHSSSDRNNCPQFKKHLAALDAHSSENTLPCFPVLGLLWMFLLNQYSAYAFPDALQQDQCHQVHPYQEMQVMYNQFSHPMPMLIYYSGPQHQTMYGAPIPHSLLVNSSPPYSPTLWRGTIPISRCSSAPLPSWGTNTGSSSWLTSWSLGLHFNSLTLSCNYLSMQWMWFGSLNTITVVRSNQLY